MIVNIGIDDGLTVLIDDTIAEYNPIRAKELCALARETFADAMADARAAALAEVEDGE